MSEQLVGGEAHPTPTEADVVSLPFTVSLRRITVRDNICSSRVLHNTFFSVALVVGSVLVGRFWPGTHVAFL